MRKNWIISLYSFSHFYVDFLCSLVLSLFLFRESGNVSQAAFLIIVYNMIAFGTQPFFGFFADKFNKEKEIAIWGIMVTTAGLMLFFQPIISALLLAFGNAMFHVGGGIVSLNLEPSKAKYGGIYVSTGVLGLFLGGVLGYLQVNPWFFVIAGTVLSIIIINFLNVCSVPKKIVFRERKENLIGVVLMLLLISVCMRSLISYSINTEWKSIFLLALLMTLATFAGKFFGGMLADKYGFMDVGIAGLLVAASLLLFFQSVPGAVIIGILAFNLVMPITLVAVAESIPNYKGTAFGLTTLALVLGYVLFMILDNFIEISIFITAIFIFLNIASLYLGIKKYKEMIV